jgi:hypothetical protein
MGRDQKRGLLLEGIYKRCCRFFSVKIRDSPHHLTPELIGGEQLGKSRERLKSEFYISHYF